MSTSNHSFTSGEPIPVNGFHLNLSSMGSGSPPVLMEAAIGDFSLTWSLVQPEVAKFARCIVYDRAGLGWSEVSPAPRTGEVMVQELKHLLAAAGVPGPVVLVGQSFSALLIRLFAYRYRDQVAGIVLLDPAHEDQFQRFPQAIRDLFGPLRDAQIAQLEQTVTKIEQEGPKAATPLVMVPPALAPDVADAYRAQSIADASRVETMMDELRNLEVTQAQVRELRGGTLGDIPLTVISHGQPQIVPGMPDEVNRAYEEAWQEMQVEIAGMSGRGKRIVAQESGHMIHHDQPGLVVDAIREMVLALRS